MIEIDRHTFAILMVLAFWVAIAVIILLLITAPMVLCGIVLFAFILFIMIGGSIAIYEVISDGYF